MFESSSVAAPSSGRVGWRARQGRSPREARAGRTVQIRRSELRIDAMVLRDAADWAAEHGVDLDDPFATGPAGGVGKYVASDGTPWIDEHVAKEYGALRGTSTYESTELIIDALDLRHRFPRIWRAIRQLKIRVHDARRISKQCRDLTREAAAAVDAELFRTAALGLPWPRLNKILAAAIINADPELHQRKLAAAKFDRRVFLSESEHGLRTLVIRADEGDQLLLYALVERIAEILQLDGDTDPVDQRRAKAAGWLARPEDLVVLLYKHSSGAKKSPEDRAADATDTRSGPDDHETPAQPVADHSAGLGEPEPASADLDTASEGDADDLGEPEKSAAAGSTQASEATTESDKHASTPADSGASNTDPADLGEPEVPQPPTDWPDYNWDAPEPPFNPGASDRLPKPRNRWYGTEHLPEPEPTPPAWCYDPPDDLDGPPPPLDPAVIGPPGHRLGSDVARLVDYLTAKGLKPARPRVNLNVHLTDETLLTGDGVVRVDDSGPMLLSQLLELLGDHGCQVSLRPVLDPANIAAVDSYEIPKALRDAVRLRHPASVFPFSSRHGSKLDIDHTVPHNHTAEPAGQTRVGNTGPLARPEHRSKTDGVWHVEQPHPGAFLWRSPYGYYFLVTNQGTQSLGPKPAPRPSEPRPTVVLLDQRKTRPYLTRSRA